MIFYTIKLQSIPKILFAQTVDIANYRNTFHNNKNFLEISVIESGSILMEYDDRSTEMIKPKTIMPIFSDLKSRTSAFHNERQRHTTVFVNAEYTLERKSTHDCIDIDTLKHQVKHENLILIPYHEPLFGNYTMVLSQIRKISEMFNALSPHTGLKALTEWFHLCEMLTDLTLKKLDEYNPLFSPHAMKYAELAQEYICRHYKESFTVSDVADALNISSGYLQSIFKSCVGMGVIEYANVYRIDLAKQLIVNRHIKLKEAGSFVGIDDPDYMSRLFKKVVGMTYREFCLQNKYTGFDTAGV